MEGVGSEVILALSVPLIAIVSLVVYNWKDFVTYTRSQLTNEVRI